ncbi:MAG: MFS transporter [Acidimicrobiia bacterium]|nr:MFS transporter [Acidimicrobiia bacterium]
MPRLDITADPSRTDDPLLGAEAPEDLVADPTRRLWILVAMCTALVAVVASMSGLNVAQQELAVDLGASQSQILWVINGYTVALAALLMPFGAIGDRWGRKRILVVGLLLFALASFASALSATPAQLMLARIVTGVGAAMVMPITLSVITSSFAGEERERAIGIWAGVAGAGGVLGLLGSSLVIDYATWPWVFALPVLLALVALAISARVVPHSHEHHTGRFDTVGSVLSAVAVGALVLGIHEGPEAGWTAPLTLTGLGVGLLALAGFVAWELREANPILDLRVFRRRPLATGSGNLLIVFAIVMALFLVLVQFFQAVLGYTALRSSFALLPMAAVTMPMSAFAPLVTRRVGLRAILVTGNVLIAAGLAFMAVFASAETGYLSVLPGILIVGFGFGLCMTPSTEAITGSLPAAAQGVASALNDTVRELGGALGIALIGSVLGAGYRASVSSATAGLPPEMAATVKEGIGNAVAVAQQAGPAGETILVAARSAFVDGWTISMWVGVGLALAAAVFAAVWTPRRVGEPRPEESVTVAAAVD